VIGAPKGRQTERVADSQLEQRRCCEEHVDSDVDLCERGITLTKASARYDATNRPVEVYDNRREGNVLELPRFG
jgi:hypothetical protein